MKFPMAIFFIFLPACLADLNSSKRPQEDPVTDSVQDPQNPTNVYVVEPCRIPEAAYRGVGLGFPRSTDRLNTMGAVKVRVLFADFPDVQATRTPQQIFDILQPTAADFIWDTSYEKMTLVLQPHLVWLRMSNPSTHYAAAIRDFTGHRDWLQEAVTLADEAVDFGDTDLVLVMATPEAEAIAYGPTWLGFDGNNGALQADGVKIYNGITSGADLLQWGGKWLAHELGHSMSLVDLYSYDAAGGFSRPFSLMDLISSEAPEYFAYERWFLGWIDDRQIACTSQTTTEELTAVERSDGFKAMAVPVAENRLLVMESRRALGWDSGLSSEGVVVYSVDTTIPSGFGTIQVENERQMLQTGQSIEVHGIVVTVEASTASADTVTVYVP